MDRDVIEAECLIAYHDEGERLIAASAAMLANRQANRSRAPFPFLRDYRELRSTKRCFLQESVKPFYRKIGGLHFLSLGRIRVSFCLTKG